MCDNNLLKKLIQQITDYSRKVFGSKLKSVVLYGSYARGDYDEESDIDIMVIVDMPPEELGKYRWGLSCLCSDLNVENSVFIVSKLQSAPLFDEWKNVLPFYQNVLKEGVFYV